ncbi:hatching enzyme 1.2-like isoform X2 [Solea solea]|nr:hatching enzyme 1.2-like isoform X2 [Solea solea]XP_058485307.1 hatching enzyme 1.2-like isoform X2 [Solea solea]
MTPVFFSLLFMSLTAILPGATENGDQMGESVDFTEVIEQTNKDLPNLSQGDIVENRNRNADPCTAIGCKWPKKGRRVNVPFIISSQYSTAQRNYIMSVMSTFHGATCIHFVQRKRQNDFLHFFPGSGCWSYVGRQQGEQLVSLQVPCLSTSVVQHEILHALGFHHEHARSDRDDHVIINFTNIQTGAEVNFNKMNTNNLQTPYDFDSVMQYGNFAFSKNGQATIIAKNHASLYFGNGQSMSTNDIERINKLYNC